MCFNSSRNKLNSKKKLIFKLMPNATNIFKLFNKKKSWFKLFEEY